MSVITKTIMDQWLAIRFPTLPLASRPGLRNLLLVMLIVLSAISVLIAKDYSRQLFIQYQNMQHSHEAGSETFGKLLLEQSTLARQARVENIAENRLAMELPSPQQVAVIKVR